MERRHNILLVKGVELIFYSEHALNHDDFLVYLRNLQILWYVIFVTTILVICERERERKERERKERERKERERKEKRDGWCNGYMEYVSTYSRIIGWLGTLAAHKIGNKACKRS